MKIEKDKNGNGFVLTNAAGESLEISFAEFWEICRIGREIDTKSEVMDYLGDCDYIDGYDLDKIRAFPELVDMVTDQVIDDRINDETGDQIYYAAEKCIRSHIENIENKVKWFSLSSDKCVSVWRCPDIYNGERFDLLLEEKTDDGRMGPGCEILSDESYATKDISFDALCETLNEICLDADIDENDTKSLFASGGVKALAEQIFSEFGMERNAEKVLSLNEIFTELGLHKGDRELFDGSFKYWSNACGDLYYHGEYALTKQLPMPLKRAYEELWGENYGCYCHLVETKNGYGVALTNEYDTVTAQAKKCNIVELFSVVQADKEKVLSAPEFKNATVYAGENSGFCNCHELIVVFPADTPVEEFTAAAYALEEIAYSSDVVRGGLERKIGDASVEASQTNEVRAVRAQANELGAQEL